MLNKKIVPTIFATDVQTFNSKLKALDFASEIHLDFMDGKFTNDKSVTISDMKPIFIYQDIKFEIHLMAYDPLKYLDEIKRLKIKKVLVQFEVFESKKGLIECVQEFKKNKIDVFLVLNPKTPAENVLSYLTEVDGVMVMSVIPGAEGQSFIEKAYDKVAFLRKNVPDLQIQVDGGIKDTNIRKIVRSGANILSVGSYVSSSENPRLNFEKLQYLIR